MPNAIQILRSNTAGNVPPAATVAGSPWVNWADAQFGVADGTVPQRLLAVRFWTSTASYAVGDYVVSAGQMYRCILAASGAGQAPPNATYWVAGGAVLSVAGKTGVVTLVHGDITDWAAQIAVELGPYALINSQAFTGTPSLPTGTTGVTQAPLSSNTRLATTQYVDLAVTASTGGVSSITAANGLTAAPATGAVAIGIAANGILNASLATMAGHTYKGNNTGAAATPIDVTAAQVLVDIQGAPLASPPLTGTPTTPTAAPGTNNTQIASTAYANTAATAAAALIVVPAPENTVPVMDGVASAGVAALYSRGDHRHPTDTSLVPLAGGTMTGQLITVAPVAAGDATNKNYVDTQIASLSLYKGVYNATTNTPALNPPVGFVAGDYVIVNVAGNSVAGIPGITTGTALGIGDLLFYDGTNFGHLAGAGLTAAAGDARYLMLAGGQTMTGFFNLAGDPTTALQSVTLQYLQNYPVDAGTF